MRIVRLLLPLLPWALLTGCAVGWGGLGGQEGEDLNPGDTDAAGGDTGTDGDTDTDDDDTDTADSDTAASGATYVGRFEVDATDASGTVDHCVGTVALRVVDGEATGAGACTFSGPLATTFPEGLGAAVLGTIAGDETAAGTVSFSSGATGDLPWVGARAATLTGTFAGELAAGDASYTVTGRFDAAPE